MLRRFIVFSTSRSIGFRSALKHRADGHKAGRPQIRGSMLFERSLPMTHPLPLIHGTSARSVGSSLRGKRTPVCPHVESHELPELVEHTSKNAPQAELGTRRSDGGFRKPTGKHLLVLSITGFGVKTGLPPWGPHVRFRRVQTLVWEGSPFGQAALHRPRGRRTVLGLPQLVDTTWWR